MVAPPPIQLANIGMADSLILMVLALVVFGPRRLPQIGRQIGKLMFEFRKASNDFKFQMEEELRAAEEAERRHKEEAERQRVAALAASSQASVSAPAPVQSIEARADIGAVEEPAAPSSDEPPLAEGAAVSDRNAEAAPVIQPPQTGEQVAASARPDYHFETPATAVPEAASIVEVNPDADVSANAEGLAAGGASGTECPTSVDPTFSPGNGSATPSKEPVSQHG